MFFHILKRDLKRKKTMNIILLIFVTLAAMFLSSSVNNLAAVNGAVEHFIDISKVPDYLAIYVTDKEKDEIDDYLKENDMVSEYEVIDGFNVMNEQIKIISCKQDPGKEQYERTNIIGLQAVPKDFIKVFNMDGSMLELNPGEIALPKLEADANDLQIGDKIEVRVGEITQEFEVVSIVKDVMFGTQFMGFKRIFISEEDYRKYEKQESLFYTKMYTINLTDEKTFKKDWQKQNFNTLSNVDGDLVEMCYVMDMLMAGILIIVSICLILITFLVLRFTIGFTLQEDYKEIGIMKAIGIKDRGIKGLYIVKYFSIAVIGAAVGFAFSFPFGEMLLEQAIVNIVVEKAQQNMAINIICSVAIVMIVLVFCYSSTNKMKKYSAMDAIRNGSDGERYKVKNHLKLRKRKRMKPSDYMAFNNILCSMKRFFILGATFCIGTMLILLPLSALNTLKSDSIVKLFGMNLTDAYIDNGKLDLYMAETSIDLLMEELTDIEEKLKENGINSKVGIDAGYGIPWYSDSPDEIYSYFTYQVTGSLEENYEILEGRAPVLENEVMITNVTAEEMNVSIGDSIYFADKDETKEYIITGTFQSLMNMGNGFRVSKAASIDYENISGIMCIQLEIESMESEEACEKLKTIFPEYNIYTPGEFKDKIVGTIEEQLDVLMSVITVVVLMINSLITALIMKTIMTKEHGDIALLKSLGFRDRAIERWQTMRILIVLVTAIVVGTVLSDLLAPFIIRPIFAMMGANKVDLVIDPLKAYVIYPLILLAVTGISAAVCAKGIRRVDLKEINSME